MSSFLCTGLTLGHPRIGHVLLRLPARRRRGFLPLPVRIEGCPPPLAQVSKGPFSRSLPSAIISPPFFFIVTSSCRGVFALQVLVARVPVASEFGASFPPVFIVGADEHLLSRMGLLFCFPPEYGSADVSL